MTELEAPQFNLEFYKPGCISIPEGTPEHETALRGTTRYLDKYYREQLALIEDLEVEKPKWFRQAEADARLFMSTFAFNNLAPIVLFAHDDGNRLFGAEGPPSTIAIQEPHAIMVKREAMGRVHRRYGLSRVGHILVHELAHATAPLPERVGVHVLGPRKRAFVFGSGWLVGEENHPKGSFFEEGFAEYAGGLYTRYREGDGEPIPLVSFKGAPSKELPPHYEFSISKEPIGGPDGYAMELLAWGLEKNHILSANNFVSVLLETRRAETAAGARREFIQAMEKFHPGLYKLLRDLPYNRENWQKALNLVHALVTQEE
jgi:hypothetical protein